MNKLNYKYETLTPFKLYVLENFPFIEADFDALTNYQIMSKIVEYLNQTRNNQNIVQENIIALNNWFNNLNVQDEVNEKIDELVEDGTISNILNNQVLEDINNKVDNLTNTINNKVDLFNPTLEYMFTHHTDKGVFQGLTADNDYYYYANAADNILTTIYKRSLSSNELIDIYTDLHFVHCNDLAILNNVLYSANFKKANGEYSRTIGVFDINTRTESEINPFETQEIINSGYLFVMQVSVYDESHLLVGLGKGHTNTSELGIFLLDINTLTYTEMPVYNNKNIKQDYYDTFQSFEYQNNRLYMLTSHPTGILEFYENNGGFYLNNIIHYSSFDNFGLSIGEIEGITKLPNNYNGNNSLLIMSQVLTFDRPNMTLKFYCFNTDTNLPYSQKSRPSQQNIPGALTEIYVDANSTNYYEDGSTTYPFKDLYSAIELLSNSSYIKGSRIHLKAGTYNLYYLMYQDLIIVADEEGVTLNGILQLDSSDIYIGGQPITLNLTKFNVSNSRLVLNGCTINYTGSDLLIIQLNSNVLFKNCIAENMGNYFNITDSDVKMQFTAISRPNSQQLIYAGAGSIIFIISKDIITTSNINRHTNAVVMFGGYINAS